ncbi:MAG TPA: hypothetical protein VN110_07900 [Sphingobium sp.]|nr:hypothetical protein [Sphingobium sp.]
MDDIIEQMRKAVEDAYQRGLRDGRSEVRTKVLAALGGPVEAVPEEAPTERFIAAPRRRAPRGLTEAVLSRVLDDTIALPLEEVQRRAVSLDRRVSEKTIYNELNRREQFFRDHNGRWRLRRPGDVDPLLIDAPQEREKQEVPTAH